MENAHDGHRQRLRERILQNDAEALQPHEVIEFLLFYAMPRRDMNPIAHALLEQFETLEGVLTADAQALARVEGMSLPAAELLRQIGRAAQHYIASASDPVILTNRMQAREHILHFFAQREAPVAWLLCLNSNGLLLRSMALDASPLWYSAQNMRLLFSEALAGNTHSVLLVQKRFDPRLQASDVTHTNLLIRSLAAAQVTVVEHIIMDEFNRIQHYVINPRIEPQQISEVSSLLAHWMDRE